MAKKVVVTGGCGFIGSHLVEKLVEKNLEVKVFDSLATGYLHNLVEVEESITVVKGDIRNYGETENALKNADFVFHLAALSYVGESMVIPESYNSVNIDGTLNVLKACSANNVQRYLFPSTCIVYGNPASNPVTENAPLRPNSPYGLTKVAGEYYAGFFFQERGLETICLRVFNAFGPRMQNRVVSIFAKAVFEGKPIPINGNGKQERDFIFVDDIVRSFLCAMNAKKSCAGKSFNVGTGKAITLNQVVERIGEIMEQEIEVEYRPDVSNEIYKLIADTSVAKKELGFEAKTGFAEGMEKTIAALKKDFGKKQK